MNTEELNLEKWECDPPMYVEAGCGPFAERVVQWHLKEHKKGVYGIDTEISDRGEWAKQSKNWSKSMQKIPGKSLDKTLIQIPKIWKGVSSRLIQSDIIKCVEYFPSEVLRIISCDMFTYHLSDEGRGILFENIARALNTESGILILTAYMSEVKWLIDNIVSLNLDVKKVLGQDEIPKSTLAIRAAQFHKSMTESLHKPYTGVIAQIHLSKTRTIKKDNKKILSDLYNNMEKTG